MEHQFNSTKDNIMHWLLMFLTLVWTFVGLWHYNVALTPVNIGLTVTWVMLVLFVSDRADDLIRARKRAAREALATQQRDDPGSLHD